MTTEPNKNKSSASGAQRRSVAMVTGAAYGIGAATTLALARAGFDLAIGDLQTSMLADTVAQASAAGARAVPIALDLRDQPSLDAAIAAAVAALGRVDVLVNNAGIPLSKPALEVTRDDWNKLMGINLTGTFFMTQAMGRYLIGAQQPGAIITIASAHGIVGSAEQVMYGVSKAAVMHMTRMLAIEWAGHGIRLNAVAPGKIDTVSPARQASVADPANKERMLARIPLGRFGTAQEVADLVCYLASPGASYITGQTVILDGGVTAQ